MRFHTKLGKVTQWHIRHNAKACKLTRNLAKGPSAIFGTTLKHAFPHEIRQSDLVPYLAQRQSMRFHTILGKVTQCHIWHNAKACKLTRNLAKGPSAIFGTTPRHAFPHEIRQIDPVPYLAQR